MKSYKDQVLFLKLSNVEHLKIGNYILKSIQQLKELREAEILPVIPDCPPPLKALIENCLKAKTTDRPLILNMGEPEIKLCSLRLKDKFRSYFLLKNIKNINDGCIISVDN